MSLAMNPYLGFAGTTREAMEHYQSVLGGELHVTTFGEIDPGAEQPDGVMHAQLETPDGFRVMAADVGATEHAGMAISLSGEDDATLRSWFDGLSTGGEIRVPLEKQVWGDVFGMFVDRFGVEWMVNIVAAAG